MGPLNVKFLLGNLQHYCVLIGPAAERLELDVNNLSVLINPSREKINFYRPKELNISIKTKAHLLERYDHQELEKIKVKSS